MILSVSFEDDNEYCTTVFLPLFVGVTVQESFSKEPNSEDNITHLFHFCFCPYDLIRDASRRTKFVAKKTFTLALFV